jgi:hypothetical protein
MEITDTLRKKIAELDLRNEVVASIETTIREDLILPTLDLVNPEICAEIVGDEVSISIGPRDWQWDKLTGERVGCGTWLE